MIYNPLVKIKDRANYTTQVTPKQPPPFFCVPGTGGASLCFYHLATHLSKMGYPVYGLDSPGILSGTKPLRAVEEYARLYLSAIVRSIPSSVYYLGGYCFGSLVAFEMARMLQAGGYRVRLVLIDAATPKIKASNQLTSQQLESMREAKLSRRESHRIPTNPDLPPEYWQIEIAAIEAASKYYPQPIDVDTLFITRYDNLLAYDKWDYLTKGNLNEQAIPCHHLEIFNEPHVKTIADWIDEFLTDSI